MSQTFSIACPKTKQRVWIGQGIGWMDSFYSGDDTTMETLRQFLNAHLGKPLVVLEDMELIDRLGVCQKFKPDSGDR